MTQTNMLNAQMDMLRSIYKVRDPEHHTWKTAEGLACAESGGTIKG